MRTTDINHYEAWQLYIPVVMPITWLNFGGILVETFFLLFIYLFIYSFIYLFIYFKHFGHISGMVGPIDVKGRRSASFRYWANYDDVT